MTQYVATKCESQEGWNSNVYTMLFNLVGFKLLQKYRQQARAWGSSSQRISYPNTCQCANTAQQLPGRSHEPGRSL